MGLIGKIVLLVDDEPVVRSAVRDILERQACSVHHAGSSEEALRLVEHLGLETIDLLLTDVALPGMNGCELALELLRRRPGLRVLFMSGYTGAEACRRYGIQANDLHFLPKPFTTAQLVERVKQVIESLEGVPSLYRTLTGG